MLLAVLFSFFASAASLQAGPDTTLPFAPRPMIDTLCSSTYFGRGYQKNGAERAAAYLAKKLEAYGVSSGAVTGDYMQTFTVPVNVLEGEPSFSVGLTKGMPGKDFLPDAATPTARLKLVAEPYDSLAWPTMSPTVQANTAIIFTAKAQYQSFIERSEGKPGLAIVKYTKLPPHTVADVVAPFPVVHVLESIAPRPGEKVSYRVKATLRTMPTANVLGMVMGTAVRDSFLIVGAHYDHLGGMGPQLFYPGANDNASGTTLVVELAAAIARQPLRYTVVFALFGAEELNLKGSSYFTGNTVMPLERVRFMLNLDLMGSGEDGATFVNAPSVQADFDMLKAINAELKPSLPSIRPRRNAPNSDHYPFTQVGVPAGFLFLQGPFAYYHSPEDKPRPELTLQGFSTTFRLTRHFLQKLAGDK